MPMGQSEIDAVRALLSSKPRPVGWTARRQRIEEVGSAWPAASDIRFEQVDIDGFPGEWSIAPGSDASRVLLYFSWRRLLLGLDPQPSQAGHRGRAGSQRTNARDRVPSGARTSLPCRA